MPIGRHDRSRLDSVRVQVSPPATGRSAWLGEACIPDGAMAALNKHDSNLPFAATRKQQLLALLEHEGEQSVDGLAQRFHVSGMTIRRDLQDLATEGKVIRTHGGAAPAARISFEFRFLERAATHAAQKQQIAELAAGLVEPGQVVMLDSGTTTLAVARQLKQIEPLTVVTTSLPIASDLFGLEHIDLILLGGTLRKDAPDLVGAMTDQNLDVLRADVAFIGADAISETGELFNASADVGRMLQRMAASSSRAFAVADSSKIGSHDLMRFGELRHWAGLITDDELTRTHAKRLEQHGARLIQPARARRSR